LRVVTVEIAPLRERREDIPLLAETFVRLAAERYELSQRSLSQGTLRRLVEYNWPGNVRELKNTIDRAVIMADGDEIAPKDLPDEITAGLPKNGIVEDDAVTDGLQVPFTADFREDRREFERRYITRCLEYTQGNVTRAAEILDMHRQSLQHKLRQLGLGRRYVSVNEAQDNPDS
jgi:DNA-binding NtrC family response regulator